MATAKDFLPLSTLQAEEEFDPYIEATLAFEETATQLDVEDCIVQRLRHPEREVTVHLPLVLDNGQVATFTAFRVQHSTVCGPAMGGVRLAADIHLNQVKAIALAATWQCALLGLPFGGSAGAIVCDPGKLSERELRALAKDYVYALRGLTGTFEDVIMRDPDSSPQMMGWMCEADARLHGHAGRGGVTGKPSILGGLPGDCNYAGRGLFPILQRVVDERRAELRLQRIAVQGFGSVGAAVAWVLFQAGARIVAVSDRSGGVYKEDGLDIRGVKTFAERNRMLFGYPEAEAISNEDLLESRCDVLILAAAPRQLNAQNASHVQAAIVLEGVEKPTTRAAEKILETRGALVIPDVLGTAGGVLSSFLEWAQNVRHCYLSPAEVEEHLKVRLQNAYDQAAAMATRHRTNLRCAAHLLAIGRVVAALRLQ